MLPIYRYPLDPTGENPNKKINDEKRKVKRLSNQTGSFFNFQTCFSDIQQVKLKIQLLKLYEKLRNVWIYMPF